MWVMEFLPGGRFTVNVGFSAEALLQFFYLFDAAFLIFRYRPE